jgi:hypothetical protein
MWVGGSVMRSREDFIENLKIVRTHLLILTEDIKYPLSDQRQEWLDGANLLIKHLYDQELKDDIEEVLRALAEKTGESE